VAIVCHRLKVPYSAGLVVAGIVLALLPNRVELLLTCDLIFNIFSRLSSSVVAAGMHFLIGWSWIGAVLFGVLIAATDPVSSLNAEKSLQFPLPWSRFRSLCKA
jgi:monovalent cation:H+ antiporter, CPA1 family